MAANVTTPRILPHVYNLGYKVGQFAAGITNTESSSSFDATNTWWALLTHFPVWYRTWWWQLVQNDPVHVFVETTLLAAILYFLLLSRRQKRSGKLDGQRLTAAEEEELLYEWKHKTRLPIVTPNSTYDDATTEANNPRRPPVVVHSTNGRHMEIAHATTTNNGTTSTTTILNFGTLDFLGMQAPTLPDGQPHPVRTAALNALDHYGCGSCGPRGFYGTIDAHVVLERALAVATGSADAIVYADAASAVTSTVAAFLKRGDCIVVDAAVYEPLRTGVQLSRANVLTYQHNDMDDLRRVLEGVAETDRVKQRKSNAQRRFVVTEGLFKTTGEVCPMDTLAGLLEEFKYRLILDESHSFGVLGKTGRGVTELFNVPVTEHMIRIVSLENALGSVGGSTVGTQEVVDHQRLCGVGYCFSASAPPFTAKAALAALELVESTIPALAANVQYMYPKLKDLLHAQFDGLLEVTSDPRSPIVVLKVADIPETEYLNEVVFLDEVAACMLDRGIGIVATEGTIRMTVSSLHTTTDLDKALAALGQAVDVVINRFHDEDVE